MSEKREAEKIIDAFMEFSSMVHRIDARKRELARLRENATRNCGNCYWWMKSRDCPIDDQRKGFPSCNHPPCGKFQATTDAISWERQYRELLAAPLILPTPQSEGQS